METSTEAVMDWIAYLGGNCRRVNGEDFYENVTYDLERIKLCDVPLERINCCWFRRWYPSAFYSKKLIKANVEGENLLSINNQLGREYGILRKHFFSLLSDKNWLSPLYEVSYSKLDVLIAAKKCGLDIPQTFVTSNKQELVNFKRDRKVIIKPLGDVIFLEDEDEKYIYSYKMLTRELTNNDIEELPDKLPFIALYQELIDKEYEVRTFFLGEDFYSMAIFSQKDKQTKLDFRNYNDEIPNRNIPYLLPAEIRQKVVELIRELKLTNGSIDFIRGIDGKYIFLEINPVGQFGMVSYPCNYFLEKRIAEHLISMDEQV